MALSSNITITNELTALEANIRTHIHTNKMGGVSPTTAMEAAAPATATTKRI
jgi:hypothetical protein